MRSKIQDKVPSEFDYECVLSVKPIELGTVAQEKIKALFAQYFRFDVANQQKVFHREGSPVEPAGFV